MTLPVEHDDRELVDRANRGEARALEALYSNHKQWVVALAWRFTGNREDALDILQETFSYFFDQFPGFELRSSLRSYLYPVVKHRSISLIRKRRKVVSLENWQAQGGEPEELSWQPEPPGEFSRLVADLPQQQREVVQLRFQLGLKLNEIAEAMDLALGTVKSRLHNALKTLQKQHTSVKRKDP